MIKVTLMLFLLAFPMNALAEEAPAVHFTELEMKGRGFSFVFYYNDQPYTGKAIDYFDNGQKKYEGTFKEGKDHGEATRWYESGQIKSQTNMIEGKLHGTITEWYENGQKRWEGQYQNGKLHGTQLKWHDNGQQSQERIYKDGIQTSEKEWDTDGTLTKEETY